MSTDDTCFGLKEITIVEICGVLAKYLSVEKATLYGSRAKGNYKKWLGY